MLYYRRYPRQRVMLELRERFYPKPLGRSPVGKIEELEKLTKQLDDDKGGGKERGAEIGDRAAEISTIISQFKM